MISVGGPRLPDVIPTPRLDLVHLDADILEAAAAGGDPFTDHFGWTNPDGLLVGDDVGLCTQFAQRVRDDPRHDTWLARAMVDRTDRAMVGHIGCHYAPDASGAVEIGYTVAPSRRRQGICTEAVRGLAAAAAATGAVSVVRASVAPDNAGSLRLLHNLGFVRVGERPDRKGDPLWVLERPVGGPDPISASGPPPPGR